MRTTNHTALVTGGATGIGLALARALAARGNRVAICGRRPEALAAAVAATPSLVPIRCDLAAPEELGHLGDEVRRRLGGLSLLVNNAAIQLHGDFAREPARALDGIDAELAVNLAAPAKVTALLLPLLAKADEAAIVNVSSGLGLVPKRSAPVYCATKAGLHLFTKALRWQMEDARTGIRVFELLPPLVDTAMTEGRGTGKLRPEEVAEAALRGMAADRWEIAVGKVRLLRILNRLSPRIAERILRNG